MRAGFRENDRPSGPPAGPEQQAGEAVYVFGYGSLMWSPGFEPAAIHPARVFGWHRRFSRVSTTSWGSGETPGLCAALHPGGTAWGRVLRLPASRIAETMDYLDRREAAYRKRPVRVRALVDGRPVPLVVMTYVADPADPTLVPVMAAHDARRYARHGVGAKGSAFDYIRNTMHALAEDGHTRSDAHRFFAMISR